ncbi:MAG: cyanophycin synthetase, partial [Acidobacteriota bacterium]|nr:cyanophycin synthetase [Acidobacteriota bacterium]
IFGIPLLKMKKSIKNFKGLEHRLEKVLTKQGVDFYNDSKATNVDATLKSIQSFKKKIILILGGRDKGEDFRRLRKTVENQVKRIILIGESRKKIEKALINTAPIDTVSSLKEAVRVGYSSAEPGEVVLLAPACTSFDMFQNFEERGEIFKKEVFTLTKLKGQSTE